MGAPFLVALEATLGTLARLFAAEGAAQEVAVLTYSTPEIVESQYDGWNGGTTYYGLVLHAPLNLYPQIEAQKEKIESAIQKKFEVIANNAPNDILSSVTISPAIVEDPQWREKAAVWLTGAKVSNQGRVRSDNVAPLSVDGLIFRSQPEIHLYRAFKSMGISFAPLPVFIRGGAEYKRIEPDFVVVHAGLVMVVEVDGDTVHQETPAEAHARTTMLLHEGVHFERVNASECDSSLKAKATAERLAAILSKLQNVK
ncbi:hypothetical protein [Ralstonia pseudosolanacearum]|uniref:hypothetical protein n=1 Tax=Ralstonia pseudosolanacearum TaxID=1310165 RepID=UPI000DABC82A|nr:hypothetical protein [Ralstonia pseudosolanacearum]RAA18466.1 hypothetical protein DOT79_04680 [Ralstonia pseudosolanacearum]